MSGPNTHLSVDRALCGEPVSLEPGKSLVRLAATPPMAADSLGLVHGGFIFGLADYAAMLAVNDPNVVLGAAESSFLKPVRVGDVAVAAAKVEEEKGRKRVVAVDVTVGETLVFSGRFTCFVLDAHVLQKN